MKKPFRFGFIIGVVYVLILATFIIFFLPGGAAEGLGMFIDLLLIPAGFIVGGILEFLFRQVGLIEFFHNPIVYWGLIAVAQGIFFGLMFIWFNTVFLGLKKLFSKK